MAVITYREAVRDALQEEMRRDSTVFVLGEDIAELVARIDEQAFDYLDAPVERVAGVDVPVPFNPVLEALSIPDAERVVKAVRKVLNVKV